MKKYILILSFLLYYSFSFTPSFGQTKGKNSKPNFIIIMADDLGYGAISCFGHKEIKTPNLDEMAKQGVKFLDYHSNGTVCSPTRAALMTGRYQQRSGVNSVLTAAKHRDKGLPLAEKTIAETLKENGYVTGLFGKWHLGYDVKFNPVNQGFDEFKGFLSGNVDYHSHVDEVGNADWWQGDSLKTQAGYTTNLITQNAISFINRHKNQPFLLYIAHEAPHYPYQGLNSKANREVNKVGKVKGLQEDILPIYKEMIELMDAGIGKTLKNLKDLKLDSNTLVIFCSDNGGVGEVNSNGVLRGTKTNLWEGGHRVPAIAKWTGHIKPNTISKETVLSMDLFPTFLEMAGLSKPKEIDGISIAKHLTTQQALPARTVFWGYGENRTAVRKGKWKLVELSAESKPELFDLENDISEKNNLADKHPEIVKTLQSEIMAWKSDVYK